MNSAFYCKKKKKEIRNLPKKPIMACRSNLLWDVLFKYSVCEWVPSVLFALLNVKSFWYIKTICKYMYNFPFCRRGSAWPWVAPAFCTGRCSRSWMKWSSMNTTTYRGHQAVRGMPYSCLPWWVGYSEGLGIMSYLGFIQCQSSMKSSMWKLDILWEIWMSDTEDLWC